MAVKTTQTASWGVLKGQGLQSALPSGDGVVTNFNWTNDPIVADEPNEVGQIIGKIVYDAHRTCRFNLNVDASVPPPKAVGTPITIDGTQFYMLTCELAETNNDFRKYNCTAECYALCNAMTMATGASGFSIGS